MVAKYFWAWAKVMMPRARRRSGRIAYIDLFAGPGRYKNKDATKSTPILVLDQALDDEDMCEMLVTIFNDANLVHVESLRKAIDSIPGISRLKHKPLVHNETVGQKLVKMFEKMHFVPTLFFVDPWGYKDLSLQLISSLLKDWGCECIVFFNTNRIRMSLFNPNVKGRIDGLFGEPRAEELRARVRGIPVREREFAIMEAIAVAFKEMGGEYVLPFRFRNARGTRTSHHLVFVTKNVTGYGIMKDIMAKESSGGDQGVPSFEYNPASRKYALLFELSRPLDDLESILLDTFAGRTMKMVEVYERHHVGRPYIKANYKTVLARLEAKGKIEASPPAKRRPTRKGKITFADTVQVTFRSVKE